MLGRWHFHTMQALANRGQPADEVWYWADAQAALNNTTGVEAHTFANGTGKVRYASPLTTMPNNFRGSAVRSVSLPFGVTALANGAFYNCTTLAEILLPEGLLSIGGTVFYGCSALALAELPAGVTSIGTSAFRGCSALALASLPSGVTAINTTTFYGCTSLAIAEIPAQVASIGTSAFYNCATLASLTFLGTPDSIASAFQFCSALTSIRVPWSEGAVSGAPWGATNATITYNYTPS